MSTKVKQVEPVGLSEIADRLGVPRQTPKTWHQRSVLPKPGPGTVSGAPWWDWNVIEPWARGRGLPRESADVTAEAGSATQS
jgi:hypothetical protein